MADEKNEPTEDASLGGAEAKILPKPSEPAEDSDEKLPDDLVPIREACKMVDRGYSTLRAWIYANQLKAYKTDKKTPNSPVMISKAELLALVVTTNKQANPGRPPPAREEVDNSHPIMELRLQLAELKGELAVVKAERDGANQLVDALKQTIAANESHRKDLVQILEGAQARIKGLEAELEVLRAEQKLPFWRRLLSSTPALPSPTDQAR